MGRNEARNYVKNIPRRIKGVKLVAVSFRARGSGRGE